MIRSLLDLFRIVIEWLRKRFLRPRKEHIRIRLESVQFMGNAGSPSGSALNLRIDAAHPIELPEWKRDRPSQFPAAYTLDAIESMPQVYAEFSRQDTAITSARIRAVVPSGMTIGIFGTVEPLSIVFNSNMSGPQPLPLRGFAGSAVGIHTVGWNWQYCLEDDNWVDFDTSHHKIYVVLDKPTSPWTQENGDNDTQACWPWTKALDWSCRWARGSTSDCEAAIRVTENVYALGKLEIDGSPGLTYDTSGHSHFSSDPNFQCTLFLARLQGLRDEDLDSAGDDLDNSGPAEPFQGNLVNCTDCACMVSTFANILGCDLKQSTMGNCFELNKIIPIGGSDFQWPFEPDSNRKFFHFHEVAWKADYGTKSKLFDALLKVNAELDHSRPRRPELPTNILFGETGDGAYRDKLAARTSEGRLRCNPLNTPVTRWLDNFRPALFRWRDETEAEHQRVEQLKLEHGFENWGRAELLESHLFVVGFLVDAALRKDWTAEAAFPVSGPDEHVVGLRSFWLPKARQKGPTELLQVETYECDSQVAAFKFLIKLLGSNPFPGILIRPLGEIGDVAFGNDPGHSRTFVRGNLVIVVCNATSHLVDITLQARAIDQLITSQPQPLAGDGAPKITVFGVGSDGHELDQKIPIDFEVKPEHEKMCLKFFSHPGEVSRFEGKLVYESKKGGPQQLQAFAIDHKDRADSSDCTFNI